MISSWQQVTGLMLQTFCEICRMKWCSVTRRPSPIKWININCQNEWLTESFSHCWLNCTPYPWLPKIVIHMHEVHFVCESYEYASILIVWTAGVSSHLSYLSKGVVNINFTDKNVYCVYVILIMTCSWFRPAYLLYLWTNVLPWVIIGLKAPNRQLQGGLISLQTSGGRVKNYKTEIDRSWSCFCR